MPCDARVRSQAHIPAAVDGIGALKQQLEVAQKEAASYKAKLANGGNGASKQSDDTGDIFELGMLGGMYISVMHGLRPPARADELSGNTLSLYYRRAAHRERGAPAATGAGARRRRRWR